jgi:choline dehydrogenase
MLGGSSSINGLVFIRGLRRDYDDWASAGCPGWRWRDVEPYFRRAERFEQGDLDSLGRTGPYTVSRIRSLHPLTERFIAACREFGTPELVDYNRGEGEGAFVNLTSQARGRRSSTANRYLATPSRMANLRIELGVIVDRVIFDAGRAVGVRCAVGGEMREVRARGQVIVSAGALQSPAVLLRSGIGPASALRELNVDVRRDAPGVGRNLQDHCGLTISKFVNVPTYNSEASGVHAVRHLCNYLAFRKGPLASAAVQAMGWVRSDPALAEPDIHLNWLPFGVDYTVSPPALHKRPCVSLGVCVSRPHSRGEVRLRSISALDKPVIDHRLIGDERDVATIKRSIGEAVALANDSELGLGAYVQTGSLERAHRLAARLEAGYVNINGFSNMEPAAPFGGYKQSGFGRFGGLTGLQEYLQTKTVFIAPGPGDHR